MFLPFWYNLPLWIPSTIFPYHLGILSTLEYFTLLIHFLAPLSFWCTFCLYHIPGRQQIKNLIFTIFVSFLVPFMLLLPYFGITHPFFCCFILLMPFLAPLLFWGTFYLYFIPLGSKSKIWYLHFYRPFGTFLCFSYSIWVFYPFCNTLPFWYFFGTFTLLMHLLAPLNFWCTFYLYFISFGYQIQNCIFTLFVSLLVLFYAFPTPF